MTKSALKEILDLAEYIGLDFETVALLIRAAILANQIEEITATVNSADGLWWSATKTVRKKLGLDK